MLTLYEFMNNFEGIDEYYERANSWRERHQSFGVFTVVGNCLEYGVDGLEHGHVGGDFNEWLEKWTAGDNLPDKMDFKWVE